MANLSIDNNKSGLYNNRHFVPFAFDIAITTACLSMHSRKRRHGKHITMYTECIASTNPHGQRLGKGDYYNQAAS
jgi:hypothetical protein